MIAVVPAPAPMRPRPSLPPMTERERLLLMGDLLDVEDYDGVVALEEDREERERVGEPGVA